MQRDVREKAHLEYRRDPDADPEFWTWCEKCGNQIKEEFDTHKLTLVRNKEREVGFDFDLCEKCYMDSLEFLEKGFICDRCDKEITDRNKMIQECTNLFCNKECFFGRAVFGMLYPEKKDDECKED